MKKTLQSQHRFAPNGWWMVAAALVLATVSLAFRFMGLKFISWDLRGSVFPWFGYIADHGLWASLREPLTNYTPPYLYLLGFASWTLPFLNRISAIKLIPLAFDVFNALLFGRIVWIKYKKLPLSCLAGSVLFLLPTVILNSAYWGQVDSVYTTFLLACLYFLLLDRPGPAMLSFGVAFSIKLQSVFLLPLLLVLTFRKRIPWLYFLLVPLVYLILVLPAALAGRPLGDLLTIYLGQADSANIWSRNAANPYIFVPNTVPEGAIYPILALAAILACLWIYLSVKRSGDGEPVQFLLTALASVALMPYILPRMHDRYFYPADVLSLLVAFYRPRLWFLPVLFQASSLLVYNNYLFEAPNTFRNLQWAVLITTVALGVTLWSQFRQPRHKEENT